MTKSVKMSRRGCKYNLYSKIRHTSTVKCFVFVLLLSCFTLQTLVFNIQDSKVNSSLLPALDNEQINSNHGIPDNDPIKRSIILKQKQFAAGVGKGNKILLGAKIASSKLTASLEPMQNHNMPINAKLLSEKNPSVPLALQMGHRSLSMTASQQMTTQMAPKGHKELAKTLAWNTSLSRVKGNVKETSQFDVARKSDERFIFNCSNIHEVKLRRMLGNGITKQVYLGIHRGRQVAVKMVTSDVIDVLSCIKHLSVTDNGQILLPQIRHRCFALANMKLMKEILLLLQLNHPGIQSLLGYCVRSEETVSKSLRDHGVIAVYEYGTRFYLSTLRHWTFAKRIEMARHLAHLLAYLENSPLGSLRISDFKEAHFLLTDELIKLTDFDDVTSAEESCPMTSSNHITSFVVGRAETKCAYGSTCENGVCFNFNARHNLHKMSEIFFQNLLFCHGTNGTLNECGGYKAKVLHLRDRTMKNIISSSQLFHELMLINI